MATTDVVLVARPCAYPDGDRPAARRMLGSSGIHAAILSAVADWRRSLRASARHEPRYAVIEPAANEAGALPRYAVRAPVRAWAGGMPRYALIEPAEIEARAIRRYALSSLAGLQAMPA